MMSAEAIDLLRSIDASLKLLVQRSNARQAAQPKPVANDRDLDGKHGDPEVKFNPRDWTGPSFKNRRFSECPADFLDLVAQAFDYFAQKADETNERANNGKPVGDYKRADAARARGWAKRIRDGRHVQQATTPAPAASGWDDEQESQWAQ